MWDIDNRFSVGSKIEPNFKVPGFRLVARKLRNITKQTLVDWSKQQGENEQDEEKNCGAKE